MVPFLYTGLPKEVGDFLWDLEDKFLEIERLIVFCGSCVELLEHSRAMSATAQPIKMSLVHESDFEKAMLVRERPNNWAQTAARMFIITAWEISHHREIIVNSINKADFISPHIDRAESKREKRIFRDAVGEYLQTFRYWSAHGSEGFSDKKSADRVRQPLIEAVRNDLVGAPEGAMVSLVGVLHNNQMTMTYNGRIVSITISWATVDLLKDWIESLKATLCHFIDTRLGSV